MLVLDKMIFYEEIFYFLHQFWRNVSTVYFTIQTAPFYIIYMSYICHTSLLFRLTSHVAHQKEVKSSVEKPCKIGVSVETILNAVKDSGIKKEP